MTFLHLALQPFIPEEHFTLCITRGGKRIVPSECNHIAEMSIKNKLESTELFFDQSSTVLDMYLKVLWWSSE
ncbi:hypothetical protein GUJ93_ZPchr0001g30246 [Zizania palustris]|uniref:Uncharacterized protein n=1 Tax=Zizania palustris TaxID=103762 RepID=A0A8J5RYT0_ZIZPA|nr:hypothetical protein GUJ93_ZPchr0001g30246 [Zizania palustris]